MNRSPSQLSPPADSRLEVGSAPEGTQILVPQPRAHWGLWYGRVFMVIWLSGWFTGLVTVTLQSFSSASERGLAADIAFGVLALCIGLGVLGAAIRLWRPAVREAFLLGRSSLAWKSGVTPFIPKMPGNRQLNLGWKRGFFGREVEEEFSLMELGSLALREAAGTTFLTIDRGLRRVEVAVGASEVERKWIHDLLVEEYRLAPTGSLSRDA